jgi:soluble lytic murein transglycosylase
VLKGRPQRWAALFALLLVALLLTPSALRAYYRVEHLPLILKASKAHGVSPHLMAAIIFTESRFRREARSTAGAVGLMQLMPETADEMADRLGIQDFKASHLLEPEINIALGALYLEELQARFSSPDLVLAAYNAGPTVVDQWRSENRPIPYAETRAYVRSVFAHERNLRYLYPEWREPP